MSQSLVAPGEVPDLDIMTRDKENPRSLINLVPPVVSEAISQVPDWYLDLTEEELRDVLKKRDEYEPALTENRIRVSFWQEYEHAQRTNKSMKMANVFHGICTRETFYKVIQNKKRLAWILCPPTEYMQAAKEGLTFGFDQLRDILGRPHVLPNGVVDTKLAQVKSDIVKMLDQRVRGAVVQKSQNLHLHARPGEATEKLSNEKEALMELTPEQLQARIKELQARVLGGKEPGKRDVEIMDAEIVP